MKKSQQTIIFIAAWLGWGFDIFDGLLFNFVAPNCVPTLLGLLRTDSGSLSVFGLDPWADSVAIHRRLAYVPGDVALWPNLSGGETVDMLLRMRGKGQILAQIGGVVAAAHKRTPRMLSERTCGAPTSSTPRRFPR